MSVGELLTAAKMNSHWSDNLRYLKGLDGAVTISDELLSVVANGGSLTAQGTANGAFARLRLLAKQTAGTVVDWRLLANGISGAGELSFYDATAGLERMRIDSAGNVGIGTSAPQGKLHAVGAISSAMQWEYNGVDGTARTVIADGAGDVLYSILSMFTVRASDGGLSSGTITANLGLSSGVDIYNPAGAGTNVCRLITNANGSVAVQRTAGGLTYKVALWLLWLSS